MAQIYLDLGDEVNKRRFKLIIDGCFQPNMHPHLLARGAPIYEPIPGTRDITFRSISQIIELCFQEVSFSFFTASDIHIVIELLERYLLELGKVVTYADEDTKRYHERALATLTTLKPHAARIARIERKKGKGEFRPMQLNDLLTTFHTKLR